MSAQLCIGTNRWNYALSKEEDEKKSRNNPSDFSFISYQGHFASQEQLCLVMQGFYIIHHLYNKVAVQALWK